MYSGGKDAWPRNQGCDWFVVRLFDMLDGWIDVTGPLAWENAKKSWDDSTANGTKNTQYGDGDYYAIYPADTQMYMTPERLGR